ncbi:MAG: ferritin-like domain-containing protein, partial [Syntrophales bacterium]|nr:ferritin-like domain-containing protein [Syntrophales bacterium]
IPIEKQTKSWSEANVTPYNKKEVHPYTRTRVIFMNGIEVEGAIFSHQCARHTDDMELKKMLALTRRIEQQQQKMINWLIPGDEHVLAVTIGYEQVAVDLTAFLARTEPDTYVKAALDFALLEDFDHLYRYANLMNIVMEKEAAEITGQFTEITIGRPTSAEHRYPFDDVRRHYDAQSADFLTKLHVLTIVAAEQQTMNFYMNVGNRPEAMLGRGLYLEIGQVEEQHVTHYESLADPRASWFERLVLHEYNECWLYHSMARQEPDPHIKKIWEEHLEMEIEHLKIACEIMKDKGRKDPEEMLPKQLPDPLIFESNIEYVRDIMAKQTDYNADGTEFLPGEKMSKDSRYREHQEKVNKGGAPSDRVIDEHKKEKGKDYRQELKGPHPIERFRK